MPRDKKIVSATMAKVKSRHTAPEIALRRALFAMGLRYRLGGRGLPGKPDIVFVAARVAVFVDGDYWHGNQWKLRGYESLEDQLEGVSNRGYWVAKIKRNMERDLRINAQLLQTGWKVARVWESAIMKSPEKEAAKVARMVRKRMGNP